MPRPMPLVCGLLIAACLAAGGARLGRGAAPEPACQVPSDIVYDAPRLALTAAALRDKKPWRIVAIGGASTLGTAAGNAILGYPHRLEDALRLRHPGVAVTVINRGVPRQTTADMIARFATDVIPADPTLVVWETGTVDAVRGNDVDQFADALAKGIAALRQHNFDVLLVNMQYNPSTGSVINFEPYLEAMRQAADLDDVYLFRRYEIMKYWSENGTFDFVDVPKGQRVALADRVYQCLGDTLADAIDHAAE
jgi:lysophospholipase L1-like esterase